MPAYGCDSLSSGLSAMRLSILALASTAVAAAVQAPFTPPSFKGSHPNVPRVQYDDAAKEPPKDMEVFEVAVSGKVGERVNLAFFADGCELFGFLYIADHRQTQ